MVDGLSRVAADSLPTLTYHVCVLGHQGMLGHIVARYLRERGHRISTVEERFDIDHPRAHLDAAWRLGAEWYVNCIGLTDSGDDPSALMAINAELPGHYSRELPEGSRLIHASSDAVFVEDRPARRADDLPDATEPYGVSKRRGEGVVAGRDRFIIRCSIVGPPSSNARGLLGWLMRQRGDVQGFVNHHWNGITTLEWARVADDIIASGGSELARIIQPGFWPPISKCQLLVDAADIWTVPVTVVPVVHTKDVTRSLLPTHHREPLRSQLARMRTWIQNFPGAKSDRSPTH